MTLLVVTYLIIRGYLRYTKLSTRPERRTIQYSMQYIPAWTGIGGDREGGVDSERDRDRGRKGAKDLRGPSL